MIPYWALWAFFFVGVLLSQRQEEPIGHNPRRSGLPALAVAGLIGMTLMIGLRFAVGGDWSTYQILFRRSGSRALDEAITQPDPGYSFINWAAQQLGSEVWLVNLVCGLLLVWGVAALARREPQPWLALLITIPYLIIVVGMGYTRQAAALGLVMVGLASLLNSGSLVRFLIFVALGTLFHKSAVICLPLVAFTGRRSKLVDLALIASAGLGLYSVFLQDSVDRLLRNYIDARYSSSGAAVRISMSLLPAIVFLSFKQRLGFGEEEAKLWRNFSLVAVAAAIALFLSPSSTAVDRVALYLLPLQFIVLARIPGTLVSRNLGNLLVSAYTAAVLFTWLNYAANARSWLPYRFWFES